MKQLTLEQLLETGITPGDAAEMLPSINRWLAFLPAAECWQWLSRKLLKPEHPFALHELLYQTAYRDWNSDQGPPPAWFPTEDEIRETNIAELMRSLNLTSYAELHAWSVQHRQEFWEQMVQRLRIRFRQPYTQVMNISQGVEAPEWFVDARLNIAESCFQAPGDAIAIIFQAESEPLRTWTYAELNALSNRIANGLVEAGFQAGDAIAIAMPMTAEAIAVYLGIVKAGCVVVGIADSFAADEIAARLRISKAKAIVTQDYILRGGKQLPLYHKVVEAEAPRAIVLSLEAISAVQLRSEDCLWKEFLSSNDQFEAIAVEPSAHTNILFSSGTTGDPKAIPWTQTTPLKCAVDGHLHQDIHAGQIVAWPTNLGWMMGPWLIYATLINQGTIALYYGAPTGREFGQFLQDARVNVLGVVPSLVNCWRTNQCMQGLDWSAIQAFSSTGECSNPQDMLFLMAIAGYKPVIEYCGGTEIGGAYVTGTCVQPCAPATFTTPALGMDLVIVDDGDRLSSKGEAFIIPPSIGLSTELLNKNHHQVYFAYTPHWNSIPLRRHGDQLERLPGGYYRALGRVDDTMNLGGIKVSAAEIERTLNTVPEICETAAIAVSPPEGGPSQLVVFAVVAPETQLQPEQLTTALQHAIRHHLNPLFKIHRVMIVESLPRTASNKVMRRILRDRELSYSSS
ncbi:MULTISPECIES: AMP-binding protein [unclassified Leptolyngbya]|uniref:AMP-binding protein n=1 Tax=unclassified Leptolyngbya TaxID=2650499 RepID=UPI0016827CCE|nr:MULTISPECIES: AMP-binding protein [unclassified Leptolyngbya]MBD1913866.1 AMP-binding protein [Leptolyngbya sp. FACHB-8]MBD2157376.1 AMP-binding protein [Leptolyngbya sp. FACHB-16]